MSWRLGGPAALRSEAQEGLGTAPPGSGAEETVSALHLLPFAIAATLITVFAGTGILPEPVSILLSVGALACYLVGLRSAIPGLPPMSWSGPEAMAGISPALLPVAAFVSASVALADRPGGLLMVLVPLWLLLILTVCPWLNAEEERLNPTAIGATALVLLTISIPLPVFAIAMHPLVPAPVRALAVGAVVLVPTHELVSIFSRRCPGAWWRAAAVAVILTVAAGASARLQVAEPLLPAVVLLGWYGLGGVASQRERGAVGAFAGFVVLAAAILAIAGPS